MGGARAWRWPCWARRRWLLPRPPSSATATTGTPLTLWTDNVAKRPENAFARFNLSAELLRHPGRAAEAQAQLEAAVRLNPDLWMVHYNLALLLGAAAGPGGPGDRPIKETVRLVPGDAQAQSNLAMLLYQRGRLAEACAHLQLAVQYDPSNRPAWLGLVQLLEELARPDDAFNAAAALVRTHPDFAGGQAELGICSPAATAGPRRSRTCRPPCGWIPG